MLNCSCIHLTVCDRLLCSNIDAAGFVPRSFCPGTINGNTATTSVQSVLCKSQRDVGSKQHRTLHESPQCAYCKWAMAVWEQGGQPTASYEWFTELVHCVFDHSPEGNEVGEMLLFITQGSCQVAKYVFEFCTIVVGGGWNNSALKAIFCQGLNPKSVHQDVMPYQAFNP